MAEKWENLWKEAGRAMDQGLTAWADALIERAVELMPEDHPPEDHPIKRLRNGRPSRRAQPSERPLA